MTKLDKQTEEAVYAQLQELKRPLAELMEKYGFLAIVILLADFASFNQKEDFPSEESDAWRSVQLALQMAERILAGG